MNKLTVVAAAALVAVTVSTSFAEEEKTSLSAQAGDRISLAPLSMEQPAVAPAAPAEDKVTGDAYVGLYNKYLFRGNDLSANKWVIQGGADLSYKNVTLSYWTNFQTKASDGLKKVTENDITLNYAWAPLELLNVNVGNNMYNYAGFTTNELYLKTTLNALLAPTLAVYWDWDEASKAGLFYTVSVSHPVEISKELAVTLGALASYNQRNPSAAVDPNSSDSLDGAYNGLHNYEFSVSADYTLNDRIKISPSYLFSNAFNGKGRGAGIHQEHVYGVKAAFVF